MLIRFASVNVTVESIPQFLLRMHGPTRPSTQETWPFTPSSLRSPTCRTRGLTFCGRRPSPGCRRRRKRLKVLARTCFKGHVPNSFISGRRGSHRLRFRRGLCPPAPHPLRAGSLGAGFLVLLLHRSRHRRLAGQEGVAKRRAAPNGSRHSQVGN